MNTPQTSETPAGTGASGTACQTEVTIASDGPRFNAPVPSGHGVGTLDPVRAFAAFAASAGLPIPEEVEAGKIPVIRIGRRALFDTRDLDKYLRSCRSRGGGRHA